MRRIARTVPALMLWSVALVACGDANTADNAGPVVAPGPTAPTGGGSPTDSPAGTSPAMATGGGPAGGAPTGGDPSSMSGSGGSGSTDAGPNAPVADAGTPTAAVTECFGRALPPLAVRGAFDHATPPPGLESYVPTDGWREKPPEELGLDPDKLADAVAFATPGSNTQAVLVVRHGYIAAEYYAPGFSQSSRFESFSMAKSFASALIGILIDQGKLAGTDVALCEFYDEWSCDASDPHSAITIDHAMNVATGLEWTEDWRTGKTTGNDIYRALTGVLDFVLSRDVVETPGSHMRYSTGDPALLSGVIQSLSGMTALEFARQTMFSVIGTPDIRWGSDGKGRTTTYAGLSATAREYAKFGQLFLQRGDWGGTQVVSAEWVAHTTQGDDPCHDWYRYLWHQNPPIRLGEPDPSCEGLGGCDPLEFANIPPDSFLAEGINGQFIFVVPSADMVIVRLGSDGPGSENWDEFSAGMMSAMLEAVR